MTPSYAIKKGVRYRYYVSCVLAQGRKEDAGSVARVAAQAVERLILDAINALPPAKQIETQPGSPSAELLSSGRDADAANDAEILAAAVDKITLGSRSIEIRLLEGFDRPVKVIAIPWSPQAFRRKREVIQPSSELASGARPIRAEARRKLLSAIAKGRRWLNEMISGKANRTCGSPASGSRTRPHAFVHGTSCPSRLRRTKPLLNCLATTSGNLLVD